MTLIDIMKAVAVEIGIEPPATATSSDPDMVKLAQFINDAGREMVRRVDWTALRQITTLTGTGTASAYAIAPNFDRFPAGLSIMAGVFPVRGSLTADEWFSLEPTQGTPRYFYLRGKEVSFYPYPRNGDTLRAQYQSTEWVRKGDSSPAVKLEADDDEPLVPGDVIAAGAVWRWRRHVGKDFADEMAEFEAMLTDRARADGGVRAP